MLAPRPRSRADDQLAKGGMGIIMISSDLPEILGMSDRILVMHEGRSAAILDRAEASQEIIIAYASGTAPARANTGLGTTLDSSPHDGQSRSSSRNVRRSHTMSQATQGMSTATGRGVILAQCYPQPGVWRLHHSRSHEHLPERLHKVTTGRDLFLAPTNIFNNLRAFSWIAVSAFGQCMVIITAGLTSRWVGDGVGRLVSPCCWCGECR